MPADRALIPIGQRELQWYHLLEDQSDHGMHCDVDLHEAPTLYFQD